MTTAILVYVILALICCLIIQASWTRLGGRWTLADWAALVALSLLWPITISYSLLRWLLTKHG
ncbi:MAG: hypothetical protein KGL39_46825 [Patescibacteria group bacterium]|nr:hypothetical protein [Patescibacteria group bacterium]